MASDLLQECCYTGHARAGMPYTNSLLMQSVTQAALTSQHDLSTTAQRLPAVSTVRKNHFSVITDGYEAYRKDEIWGGSLSLA